jgi:hypothetical protein
VSAHSLWKEPGPRPVARRISFEKSKYVGFLFELPESRLGPSDRVELTSFARQSGKQIMTG